PGLLPRLLIRDPPSRRGLIDGDTPGDHRPAPPGGERGPGPHAQAREERGAERGSGVRAGDVRAQPPLATLLRSRRPHAAVRLRAAGGPLRVGLDVTAGRTHYPVRSGARRTQLLALPAHDAARDYGGLLLVGVDRRSGAPLLRVPARAGDRALGPL